MEKETKKPEDLKVKKETIPIPKDPKEFEEIFGFNPTEVEVLIATPCYGGLLYNSYLTSLISTMKLLSNCGIKCGVKTIANESLITRARNTIVSYFLTQEEYTHLLFIDADISWNPSAVLRLLGAKKPVVSGIYPKKAYNWKKMENLVSVDKEWKEINISRSLDYAVNFNDPKLEITNGRVEAKDVPTGFMLIERNTIEVLKEKFPELKYKNNLHNLIPPHHDPDTFWLFFDCIKDEETDVYLSEDYAFCRRVQQAGLSCWADLTIDLNHTGTHTFEGSFSHSLFGK
jgi:hypothetical protein